MYIENIRTHFNPLQMIVLRKSQTVFFLFFAPYCYEHWHQYRCPFFPNFFNARLRKGPEKEGKIFFLPLVIDPYGTLLNDFVKHFCVIEAHFSTNDISSLRRNRSNSKQPLAENLKHEIRCFLRHQGSFI